MHFGEHLTIDGYNGDPALLNSKDVVESAISELAQQLRMHPLGPIQIVSAPDNHIKDPGGWSAIVIIAESHISIHTFPRRHFLSADVYTCQNGIDVDFVESFFMKKFGLGEIEKHFIKRGKKYPEHNIF
ncbi:MAG TPA: S-adenosylmethionine decarboxylase [Candidatus Paceibacterota bacterium]